MRKNTSVNIRLTTEEKEQFLRFAEESGFGPNLSEFIRQTVLNKNYKKILENEILKTSSVTQSKHDSLSVFLKNEISDLKNQNAELLKQNENLLNLIKFMFLEKDVYEKKGMLGGGKKELTEEAKEILNKI